VKLPSNLVQKCAKNLVIVALRATFGKLKMTSGNINLLTKTISVQVPYTAGFEDSAAFEINYYVDGNVEVLCASMPSKPEVVISALQEVLVILNATK
jgi:hypothetical protein